MISVNRAADIKGNKLKLEWVSYALGFGLCQIYIFTTDTEDTRNLFFVCPSAARECVIALFVTLREECL